MDGAAARGEQLAATLHEHLGFTASVESWGGRPRGAREPDVVVNATSIGLFAPDALVPVDVATPRPGMVVADVVYNPVTTRPLAEAANAGATPLDDLSMYAHQVRWPWSGGTASSPTSR